RRDWVGGFFRELIVSSQRRVSLPSASLLLHAVAELLGTPQQDVRRRSVGLDSPCLGQVDRLVGQSHVELPVSSQLEGQPDREGASLPELALQVDFTTKQPGQLADNRQPQPGALMLTSQNVVLLTGHLGLP